MILVLELEMLVKLNKFSEKYRKKDKRKKAPKNSSRKIFLESKNMNLD